MEKSNEKRPLYCYKFLESSDANNSKLERIVIDDWHLKKGLYRDAYRFKLNCNSCNHVVREDRLDRFAHGKMFTFNPDPNFAMESIAKQLKDDLEAAQTKLTKAEHRWKCWLELQDSIAKFESKNS